LNRIAFINLSTQQVIVKDIPEELLRRYLGGDGLNAYLLFNYLPPDTDALFPDNVLIFGAGMLTGHCDVSLSRFQITAKSPETGGFGTSNAGGFFGPELRFAGFQHLVITGKASRPTYLWVHDGEIEFKDASFVWSKDVYETHQLLMAKMSNPDIQIATIGCGGENLVRFACVMHGLKRAAGRTGMGCVMGSKLLKAVVVKGSQSVNAYSPERMKDVFDKHLKQVTSTKLYPVISRYGTLTIFAIQNEGGQIPVMNHQYNYFEAAEENLEDEIFEEQYKTKTLACFSCPLRCSHRYRIKYGPYQGVWGEGPEYYMMAGFGPMVGNNRWDVILAANDLINRYGLDIGSVGGYIGWLMELWQRGILTERDTGGLNLEWGNPDAIMGLINQMAHNEGLGGMVGQSASHAAEEIGKGSDRYLYQQRGLMHECSVGNRASRATALAEATTNRGYDHLRGRVALEFFGIPTDALAKIFGRPIASDFRAWEGKPYMAMWQQHFTTVIDSLGYCKFATVWPGSTGNLTYKEFAETINVVTGWDVTPQELMVTGERIWNLERMIVLRETGIGREGDIPPRVYFEPNKLEPLKGEKLDREEYEARLDEYYELRGWNKDGTPKRETLARLKLDEKPSHLI